MVVAHPVGDGDQLVGLFEQVLGHCGAALPAAVDGGEVGHVLAVDVLPGQAEGTDAAGVLGHYHHPVPDFPATGLGHLHHFAGGFVAQLLAGCASQEALIFGTHGRGVDFYDNPILFGLGCGYVYYPALVDSGNDCFAHRFVVSLMMDDFWRLLRVKTCRLGKC